MLVSAFGMLLEALTPREREVAEQFARGRSYKEVALELHIAPTTVRNHLARIYDKLGLDSGARLAAESSFEPTLIRLLSGSVDGSEPDQCPSGQRHAAHREPRAPSPQPAVRAPTSDGGEDTPRARSTALSPCQHYSFPPADD
jgi:DNA-binding CsgD family transcriptional regulator